CEAVVAQIEDPPDRAWALVAILGALAPVDPVRGQRLLTSAETAVAGAPAGSYRHPELGVALANTPARPAVPPAPRDPPAALATRAWPSVLVGLARVEPQVVAAVANELGTRWGFVES